MFASEHEGVIPDMMVMAKGLTGGYLPLAITLISEKLFSAFDGSVAEGKALAYGHSYTGNALACAAAKASLEIFENEHVLEALQPKIRRLSSALADLEKLPGVKKSDNADLLPVLSLKNQRERSPAQFSRGCLYRGASPWTADQANRQCRRSDAAVMHHDRSVN